MTRDELLTRFLLTLPPEAAALPRTGLDQAAVLLPLVERDSGLHLLLTRRSSQLRHHGGQVSLPGGRRDPGDESLIATALRETREELGIAARQLQILGCLPPRPTVSRFWVQPVIGLLDPNYVATPNPDEVARVFEVPLGCLLDPRHYHAWTFPREGRAHTVWFLPWQDELIWGATAAIIRQLAEQTTGWRQHWPANEPG
ncbi:CoA pyrophosphatase [Aeromonas simiae]|uniref:CoA pyrophosphatase n=1 Tax=Aeromonas simiae TaxID=218936 RepID=UPI0005A74CCF|nr:CoA pyrophosphatase [Aeromonas simiae]